MSEILRLNKLTATSALRAGQTLKLPQEKAVVAKNTKPQPESVIVTRNPAPITDRRPSERPEPATDRSVTLETGTAQHKVVTGDTFSSIRRAYGVTETQLAKANPGVNAKSLKIGQSLTIPSQPIPIRPQAKPLMVRADGRILAQRHDPLMTAGGTDEGVSSDRTRTGYLVEEGDNIEKVARRFSTTEHEIRRLNRMGDADEISPGRYILVPFIRQAPEASAFARRDT
jgi:LysM repeat protein